MSFNSEMKGADVVALLKNGLPIVDSVDKLDANATFGSIACVAKKGSVSETSWEDLYQPDASIADMNTGDIDVSGCDQVSSIKIIPPVAPIPIALDMSEDLVLSAYFVSEGMNMMGSGSMAALNPIIENVDGVGTAIVGCVAMTMTYEDESHGEYILFHVDDAGEIVANQEDINAFNDFISDFYYIGPIDVIMEGIPVHEAYTEIYDSFAKVVVGSLSRAHIYLKKDSWEKLCQTDFEKLTTDINATKKDLSSTKEDLISIREDIEHRAHKIPVVDASGGRTLTPNVYTTIVLSSTYTTYITLAAIQDATVYNEYILELKCDVTPSLVSFLDENRNTLTIKWPNDTAPVFVEGFTYMISIVNGFGVYSTFKNS